MPSIAKQIIPYVDLLAKVQDLLLAYPRECRNLHIGKLQVLAEQQDGANWYAFIDRRSGADHDEVECRERIASEIRRLRQCYDVEVP